MYNAKVLADSISKYSKVRLTTLEVVMPRIILAEFNTHRVFSRNSASSRAIPVKKRIDAVRTCPYIPEVFGKNQKGMQASQEIVDQAMSRAVWLAAAEQACEQAEKLADIGVHKQWANRLLEPYSWHTVIVSATEWENFFNLRRHPDAQPEIQRVANLMHEAMENSTPEVLDVGEWHLPLIFDEDYAGISGYDLVRVSAGRCARVSYLTHDGKRDLAADEDLASKLIKSGHMSPMEHQAQVGMIETGLLDDHVKDEFIGNFRLPWIQYRKFLNNEAVFRG